MNRKIVFISDTHGKHKLIPKNDLGDGDLIIHAGDVSELGGNYEIKIFLDWFSELPFEHKIFIAGNHDFWFEHNFEISKKYKEKNVHYLYENCIEIDNIKIFGTPWQPEFLGWAFNLPRNSKELDDKWNKIPKGIDILITHNPIFGILDNIKNDKMGCELLYKKVFEIKPKIHVFGHNHINYGKFEKNGILFLNASVLNEKCYQVNKPIIINFDTNTKIVNYFDEDINKIKYI
jgi:predicted phosphodiesterase